MNLAFYINDTSKQEALILKLLKTGWEDVAVHPYWPREITWIGSEVDEVDDWLPRTIEIEQERDLSRYRIITTTSTTPPTGWGK